MLRNRNSFFQESMYNQQSFIPNNFNQMMPNINQYNDDIENKIAKLERQINRLDARISKLEGANKIESVDLTNNMYML